MKSLSQLINFEYRSKKEINGWPLIHINLGIHPETGRPRVAKGVVAMGNIAVGIVSIGAVAFGVVTLAGFGLGIVSLAGFAIGMVSLGAIALGNEIALGAVALSSKFALGVITPDVYFVVAPLIFVAFIALILWVMRKAREVRL